MRDAALPVGVAATLAAAATLLVPAAPVLSTALPAQEPRIVTTLDTTTVTVGDRLTLEVSVRHAPGASVLWPDSLDLAPFEVLEVDTLPVRREGGFARSGLRIVVTAFELGVLEIPPVVARVVPEPGDTTTLAGDRWRVEIVSVGLDEEGGIREIRGPRSIPVGARTLLPWLAAVVVLGLLGWRWLRRRRAAPESSSAPVEDPRPPGAVALDALDALAAADLPGRGEIKRFHVEVSEIVRSYLEDRYGVPALETTTGELMAALARGRVRNEVPDDVRLDLGRFLERCDLVKFAKYEPTAEASRELIPVARSVVERTRPAAAAVPSGTSPSSGAPPADVEGAMGGGS